VLTSRQTYTIFSAHPQIYSIGIAQSAANALSVAILSSGMIASPETLSTSWGYSIDEKIRASRECKHSKPRMLDIGRALITYLLFRGHCSELMSTYRQLCSTIPYSFHTSHLRPACVRTYTRFNKSLGCFAGCFCIDCQRLGSTQVRCPLLDHCRLQRIYSLTLARLSSHPDDAKVMQLTGARKQAFIDREIGRRLWTQICSQEWQVGST
jgi:hypothetical protein